MNHYQSIRVMVSAWSLALVLGGIAAAVPTQVVHTNLDNCDPLFIPFDADELGFGLTGSPPFPPDELIGAASTLTPETVCTTAVDNPNIPNAFVQITNLTTRDFSEVWYVADRETTISNYDGAAEAAPGPVIVDFQNAFRIDSIVSDPGGVNHPLVFESIAANDIFEAGETWQFIIQDYTNGRGLLASALNSVGIVSLSAGTMSNFSSGNIVAIPEPSGLLLAVLAALGACGLGLRRQGPTLSKSQSRRS